MLISYCSIRRCYTNVLVFSTTLIAVAMCLSTCSKTEDTQVVRIVGINSDLLVHDVAIFAMNDSGECILITTDRDAEETSQATNAEWTLLQDGMQVSVHLHVRERLTKSDINLYLDRSNFNYYVDCAYQSVESVDSETDDTLDYVEDGILVLWDDGEVRCVAYRALEFSGYLVQTSAVRGTR